jgi:hypothetical protein
MADQRLSSIEEEGLYLAERLSTGGLRVRCYVKKEHPGSRALADAFLVSEFDAPEVGGCWGEIVLRFYESTRSP